MATLKTLSIIFIVVLDLGLYSPTVSSQTREGIGHPLGSNYRGRPRAGEGYSDQVGFGEKGNVVREGIGHPLGSIHTVRYGGRPLAGDSFHAGEGSPDQVGNGDKGNVVREGIGHPLGSVPTVRFGGARSANGADGIGSGEKVELVREGIGYPLGTLPGRYGRPGGFHHTAGGGGGTNTGRSANGADGIGSGEKVELVREGIGYPLGTLPGRYGRPGGFHYTAGGGGGTNTGRSANGVDGIGSGEKVELVREGIGYPLGTLPGRYGRPGGFHHTAGGGGGTNTGRATYRERDNIVLYGSK